MSVNLHPDHGDRSASELMRTQEAFVRLRPYGRNGEAREIFLENKIWFSDIKSQDDAFEGAPIIQIQHGRPTREQLRAMARRQLPDADAIRIAEEVERINGASDLEWAIQRDLIKVQMEELFS